MNMDRQWMMISLVALILVCSGCSEYTDNLAGSNAPSDTPEVTEVLEDEPEDTNVEQIEEAPLVAIEIPASDTSDNEDPSELPASLPESDPTPPTVVSEPVSPPSDEPAPPVVNEPVPVSPTLVVSFCLVSDKKHSKSRYQIRPLTLVCSPGKSLKTELLTITFILYNQKADADEALWTETKTVEITHGVLLETLGLENPIPEEFLDEGSKLSLGIQIEEEDEVEIWKNLWILKAE